MRSSRSAGDANHLTEHSLDEETARKKLAVRDEKCAAAARVTPLCGVRAQNAGSAQMVGFFRMFGEVVQTHGVAPVSTNGENQL